MLSIYDTDKKIVVLATNLSITEQKNPTLWGLNQKTVELKMILDDSASMWAVDWYQSQVGEDGLYQVHKKDIHVENHNVLLKGCFMKCYSRVSNSQTEVILGCDCTFYPESNDYKQFYREYRIERLLD